MVPPLIRRAEVADSAEICAVIRASITELCHVDHKGEAAPLQAWLANKTPKTIACWIENPEYGIFVLCKAKQIAAVGGIISADRIGLLYVSPEHRFCGASKALLQHLEHEMRSLGAQIGHLQSTVTAYAFYQRLGWKDEMLSLPGSDPDVKRYMFKPLTAT
jgi:GNAT superfamily N-acetyltransferase